jgi:hypothetical protein
MTERGAVACPTLYPPRLYIVASAMPEARLNQRGLCGRSSLKPEEIRKLDAYFKRTFQNPQIQVKARPRKEDSAEVYVGEEFLGIVFKDEEDGDYNFSMAILDIDLN